MIDVLNALHALGYVSGRVLVKIIDKSRLCVYMKRRSRLEYMGIYDLQRKTFVD